MITGSQKCSTGLSYFKVKEQSLGFGGGRAPFEWGTAWVLHLLSQLQVSPSLKDDVFTGFGTLLYHSLMVGEESSRNCPPVAAHALYLLPSRQKSTADLLNFTAAPHHPKAVSALNTHSTFTSSSAYLGRASWHKAVQSVVQQPSGKQKTIPGVLIALG